MLDYVDITNEYLLRNRALPEVYTFEFNGRSFVGLNTVFAPPIFEDSFFFCEALSGQDGEKLLEIGSGTGLIAVTQALTGCNVTAVDLNPDAVANTRINSILHGVEQRVDAFVSDVFEQVDKGARFDRIFWNAPFVQQALEEDNLLQRSVFDPNYRSIQKYLSGFDSYLKDNGEAFLGFSSTSGDRPLLERLCRESRISLRLIQESRLADENGNYDFILELFELTKT
ncbi:MAG TPA: methyltransferase [Pyrinomonadaceae bacterium]|nr:methyltransferase [Pyrinomonadaceae bacterium]